MILREHLAPHVQKAVLRTIQAKVSTGGGKRLAAHVTEAIAGVSAPQAKLKAFSSPGVVQRAAGCDIKGCDGPPHAAWCPRAHGVAPAPAAAVPAAAAATPWRKTGKVGMNETDAALEAAHQGWNALDVGKLKFDSHKPNGRVYTDGKALYGADNSGHVGWGFKIWKKKKGIHYSYQGNLVWDGSMWKHDARGTTQI